MQAGVLVDKLRRRQVEGQEQIARPAASGLGGLAQHQLRQRADDAAFLGDRDEDARRHHAEVAIGPARQCLEADGAASGEIDDGLEMRLHLAGRNGTAQRLLDTGDALGGFLHLAGVDDDPATARALGMVERGFGLVDEDFGGLVAGVEQRAANRGRKPGGAFADIIGRRKDLDQHARLLRRRLLAEHHRIEIGELVGADAADRGVAVHRRAQPHRHLDQDVVAGLVAEQIVDRLEAVEVENADGEGRRVLGPIADQAVDLVEEAAMIAKPGQRIREGQIRCFPCAACRQTSFASLFRCPLKALLTGLAANRLRNVSRK